MQKTRRGVALVEEGAKRLLPSSSEISLPATPVQHTQTSRMPTLNFTLSNIERHAKTPSNRARNTIQNHEQRSNHKQKK